MNTSFTNHVLRAVAVFALMFSNALFAQTGKEILEGREFYFGVPHCDIQAGEAARGNPIQLWVSCKVQTRISVTVPRTGMNIGNYVIQPKKVQILPVPQSLMNTTTGVTDNGVYIKSDDPITVTVFVSYKWTGEAYRVIPAEVLGKRYFTLNMYQDKTDKERPAQLLVVATKDNTVVSVSPKTLTEDGIPAGGSKNYKLMRGQTLLVKAKIQTGKDLDWSTDLTGTKIIATSPVAVFSGHTKGAFPRFQPTMLGTPANFMRNMMMDAMWPVEFLGKEYFSAPIM
ncbi:MAG: IgGFc-binding protein, partial [Candidatus Kapaibacterium sp.]